MTTKEFSCIATKQKKKKCFKESALVTSMKIVDKNPRDVTFQVSCPGLIPPSPNKTFYNANCTLVHAPLSTKMSSLTSCHNKILILPMPTFL